MLSRDEARNLVAALVCGQSEPLPLEDEIVIVDEATIERPWGWVFFYNSKLWLQTRDIRYALAGNAPFLVERESGRVLATGTAYPVERYIENYERHGDPNG
jgi:hypothetical protein